MFTKYDIAIMHIQITLDEREDALYQQFQTRYPPTNPDSSIRIQSKVLTLGDISIDIVDHEDVAKCALLIERKTIPDLLSSIKDGRYKIGRAHV